MGVFNKTIIPPALVGYEMIIANEAHSAELAIGTFKIQRRGRQGERQKNNRFNKQNNNFARASHYFVHFVPVFTRLRRENA